MILLCRVMALGNVVVNEQRNKLCYRTFSLAHFLERALCSSILNLDSGKHSITKIDKLE